MSGRLLKPGVRRSLDWSPPHGAPLPSAKPADGDRYRTAPAETIIQMLLFGALAYERDAPDAREIASSALERWTGLGLPAVQGPEGDRFFDPVEVTNFIKQAALDGRDSFWPEHYVRTGQRLVADFAARRPGPYRLMFRRLFNLEFAPPGRALRLRAPAPLDGAGVRDLRVATFSDGLDEAVVSTAAGRIELRSPGALARGQASLGADISFEAAPDRQSGDADLAPYLKPREGLIAVSPAITALAEDLAKGRTGTLEVVRAFWNHIDEALTLGAVHYDQIDPEWPCDWVLQAGWADCQLASAVFIALCRARELPARMVSGYQLYRLAPAIHYWAEVWFEGEGWRPFDFMSLDLCFGGRDLEWRDRFFGRVDDRLVTQRLPLEFTGAPGVAMPSAWRLVQTWSGEGAQISLTDLDGRAVYTDFLSVSG